MPKPTSSFVGSDISGARVGEVEAGCCASGEGKTGWWCRGGVGWGE